MITQIEISGFKTFRDLKLELAPLHAIIGPNGAGKSNLFDALRLMSKLADEDLRSAFQDLRGEAGELFTTLGANGPADRIRFGVEMLIERTITDDWGETADLKFTRLRYDLEIERRTDGHGLERLHVCEEKLNVIPKKTDGWLKRFVREKVSVWRPPTRGRGTPLISTEPAPGTATINLHQDGRHGRRKPSVAEKVERTVLSGVANTEFPHAFAAREEMRSWRFLQLNPEALRQPSAKVARPVVEPDGSNLPTALARLKAKDPHLLIDISRDLANLVPEILDVVVEDDEARERYVVWAQTQDGRRFSSRVLSDGTLRLLALAALKNDPDYRGVLCFEEPENGVHPFRLRSMVSLLRGLATDFSEAEDDEPLRQLVVNTHSPVLLVQLVEEFEGAASPRHALSLAYMPTHVAPELGEATRITRIVPVNPSRQTQMEFGIGPQERSYTLADVERYLDSADAGEAIKWLKGDVPA